MTIPLETQLSTVLVPVFGNEIYPIVHPDPDGTSSEVASLYAIYTVIGGQSFNKLDGDSGTNRVKIQISIYSIDYSDMKIKQNNVDAAMKAANLLASNAVESQTDHYQIAGAIANVSVSVPIESFETDTKRFYTHMEFYCWSLDGENQDGGTDEVIVI